MAPAKALPSLRSVHSAVTSPALGLPIDVTEFQVLMRADMGSQRNVLIVGFAFLMALGLPGWVDGQKTAFFAAGIPGQVLWAILKTPMAVAGVCAAFWDSLIPGTPEERGIGVQPR